jgi:hypothetical protein
MEYKGVTYDIGTEYLKGFVTRDEPGEDSLIHDMQAIRNVLKCNSVRIYGKDPERLMLASRTALLCGLNVWLSPRLIGGTITDTLAYIKAVAEKFEILRQEFSTRELVLIVAGEATIDLQGFVKGESIAGRISNLLSPLFFLKNAIGIRPSFQRSFTGFLKDAALSARASFKGKVTYAGGIWEKADWSGFDFLCVNLYRASFNRKYFDRILNNLASKDKPLIISEFGCCSYEGADSRGPTGHSVLDLSKIPPVFIEKCIRNENVQAGYIIELLEKFEEKGVTGAFVFDFVTPGLIHSADPEKDLDMASYSVTKSTGNGKWEPKESFFRIADFYGKISR